jgi:soluble P-type ATPase
MLRVAIPGFKSLALEHLVADFNGTLAGDGHLLPGLSERLEALARLLEIHILTADTYGRAAQACRGLKARLKILEGPDQAQAKLAYVQALGPERVVCLGNGRNDRLMLRAAALGIAVSGPEGTAVEALTAAHVLVADAREALALLEQPTRLVATLRD